MPIDTKISKISEMASGKTRIGLSGSIIPPDAGDPVKLDVTITGADLDTIKDALGLDSIEYTGAVQVEVTSG